MSDISHPPIGMLSDKIAVITGAGQGIGRACVDVFLREGAKIVAVDFSGKQNAVAEELGENVVPFHADVSKEDEIKALFAFTLDRFGRVDASIHAAGTQGGRQGLDFTLDDYELYTATNLRGIMFLMQEAAKAMAKTGGGSIVNYTSVAGVNGEHLAPLPYSAAKAAVHMVGKVLAVDYAQQNVRVNSIACGFTLTEMMADASPEVIARMSAKIAMNRPAKASEQAEVAAFLASDRASFVTGTVIPVDGGWTAKIA